MLFSLSSVLLLSGFLFAMGVACILVRRNAIQILMGVELVLNAAAMNFIAFGHFVPEKIPNASQAVAIFVIVLAAAEAVVALALILSIYRLFRSVEVETISNLRG